VSDTDNPDPGNPDTLRDLLESVTRRHSERRAITLPEVGLRYADVNELANRGGNLLLGSGCGEGDIVMARCHNSLTMLATWLGCAKIGAVFMPVNSLLTGEPLHGVVSHAGGKIMICDSDLAPEVVALRGRLPGLRDLLVAGPPPPAGGRNFDTLLRAASSSAPPPLRHGSDAPAKLMYTSGTTGRPKGAMWSRHAEALHVVCYGDELVRVDPGENTYACLPLFHATCQGTALGTLWRGGHIAIDRSFDPFRFWSRIRESDAVFFPYVGTILSVLAKRSGRREDGDNPVRRVMGSAAPQDLWPLIEERFGLVIEDVWGQTELASCWTRPVGERQRPGTVGAPTDRFVARIANVDGGEAPRGTPGEMWIRPHRRNDVFDRYYHDDEGTSGMWTADGWYRTGDQMLQDDEGDFVFLGRMRDAIRRRGEMITPGDIEQAALLHPLVMEAAAVAVPAPHGVEDEVKLCVVARDGADLDCRALRDFLQERLPAFMVPRYIQPYSTFPKTLTTRIQKYQLRDDGVGGAWDARSAILPAP